MGSEYFDQSETQKLNERIHQFLVQGGFGQQGFGQGGFPRRFAGSGPCLVATDRSRSIDRTYHEQIYGYYGLDY